MKISEDSSLVDYRLIDNGYAKLGVVYIAFDSYYNDIEKEANINNSKIDKENGTYYNNCSYYRNHTAAQMRSVIETINNSFKVYNIHDVYGINSECSYNDDWDLYFWFNTNIDKDRRPTFIRFDLNDKHSYKENMKIFERLMNVIQTIKEPNIECIIRYKTELI